MTQEADEKKIADRCLPLLAKGPLSTIELRSRLGSDVDSSQIYRALAKDDRFERIPWGTYTAFRLKNQSRARTHRPPSQPITESSAVKP